MLGCLWEGPPPPPLPQATKRGTAAHAHGGSVPNASMTAASSSSNWNKLLLHKLWEPSPAFRHGYKVACCCSIATSKSNHVKLRLRTCRVDPYEGTTSQAPFGVLGSEVLKLGWFLRSARMTQVKCSTAVQHCNYSDVSTVILWR